MASTGRRVPDAARRGLLKALALAPLGAVALPSRLGATEYATAAEALGAVDRLEADVAARLAAIAKAVPAARPFTASVLADHERHRAARARVRRRLGLPPGSAGPAKPADPTSLGGLRAAQESLVYAHAEGLPALGDPLAVDTLARNLVDLSRHLTVIDLWIEAESARV